MKKRVFAALISLISMNVVCLSLLTFAWFTANQKVDNGMSNITAVSDDPIDVNFELYEYDEDNLTGRVADDKTVTDEDTGVTTMTSKFALPQYDTFITERNIHNNKILRVEVVSKKDVDLSSKFSLSIPCSGTFAADDKVTRNMSNIIGFKYFLRHETTTKTVDETDAGTIYDSAFEIFEEIDEITSYVTVNDGVGSKASDNTIHLTGLDIDESAEDSITVLYIEYFYDESLINYYFEHSNDSKPTADNLESSAISFACDIIRFEFTGGDVA